jgi:hypothetical protein
MKLKTLLLMLLAIAPLALSVGAISAQNAAADRAQAIKDCEANGGIPVVIAGVLSSRGIGCAQPLGD